MWTHYTAASEEIVPPQRQKSQNQISPSASASHCLLLPSSKKSFLWGYWGCFYCFSWGAERKGGCSFCKYTLNPTEKLRAETRQAAAQQHSLWLLLKHRGLCSWNKTYPAFPWLGEPSRGAGGSLFPRAFQTWLPCKVEGSGSNILNEVSPINCFKSCPPSPWESSKSTRPLVIYSKEQPNSMKIGHFLILSSLCSASLFVSDSRSQLQRKIRGQIWDCSLAVLPGADLLPGTAESSPAKQLC